MDNHIEINGWTTGKKPEFKYDLDLEMNARYKEMKYEFNTCIVELDPDQKFTIDLYFQKDDKQGGLVLNTDGKGNYSVRDFSGDSAGKLKISRTAERAIKSTLTHLVK